MEIPDHWAEYAPPGAARLEQYQAPPAAAQDATPSAAPTRNTPSPLREGVPEQLVGIAEIELLRGLGRLHALQAGAVRAALPASPTETPRPSDQGAPIHVADLQIEQPAVPPVPPCTAARRDEEAR